jgi:hypothetical protein
MDKEKLKKWLISTIDASPLLHLLLLAIENGKFDKEPCDECIKLEKFNSEYQSPFKYCNECGRKLEDTNHD